MERGRGAARMSCIDPGIWGFPFFEGKLPAGGYLDTLFTVDPPQKDILDHIG